MAVAGVPARAGALEALLRRDRLLVAAGLAAAAALTWAYQLYMAWAMAHHAPSMALLMPHVFRWSAVDLALLFATWAVMMAAMMLPAVAPTVLAFAQVARRRAAAESPLAPAGAFLGGYLAAWIAYSLLVTLLQWRLHEAEVLAPDMAAARPAFAGALLVATGAFQWTPWKDACLAGCRAPLGFVLQHAGDGPAAALRAGLLHGAACVGCCALLMALLFVNGVMNVGWMALLTAFVLLERLAPGGRWTARLGGLALMAWGAWVIAG